MQSKVFNRQLVHKGLRMPNSKGQNASVMTFIGTTNGTTAVSLFGNGGAPAKMTIVAVQVIAKDTTAGNITLQKANGDDISVIAKGTTAGAVIGEDGALANTSIPEGNDVNIVSSSSGNAVVIVHATIDAA